MGPGESAFDAARDPDVFVLRVYDIVKGVRPLSFTAPVRAELEYVNGGLTRHPSTLNDIAQALSELIGTTSRRLDG